MKKTDQRLRLPAADGGTKRNGAIAAVEAGYESCGHPKMRASGPHRLTGMPSSLGLLDFLEMAALVLDSMTG